MDGPSPGRVLVPPAPYRSDAGVIVLAERIAGPSDVCGPEGLPQLEQKRAESELTVPQLEQIMGEPQIS